MGQGFAAEGMLMYRSYERDPKAAEGGVSPRAPLVAPGSAAGKN